VFVSEEGIKCTDGVTVYDIGKRLGALAYAGFWAYENAEDYSAAYYPVKKQLYFNVVNLIASGMEFLVGHWLSSLYTDITPEFAQQDIYIGWTYHTMSSNMTQPGFVATYTDSDGIERVVYGGTDSHLYEMDRGAVDITQNDEEEDIEFLVETGWFPLNTPASLTKTIRSVNLSYAGADASNVNFYIDVDFVRNTNYVSLTGGGTALDTGYPYYNSIFTGFGGMVTENFNIDESACGKMFSFRLQNSGSSGNGFTLLAIEAMYRVEGIR
jgi:hypothetical protein